ncbi:hypothetical protein [Actinophytocola sp.]|uniref:hypothetical protein n=1 Tax=Actinophytocola sp. TaxID=1872138 RepID=UPI002ED5FBB0
MSTPTIRVLSLGAGTQSTTLALLAVVLAAGVVGAPGGGAAPAGTTGQPTWVTLITGTGWRCGP